MAKRLKSLEIRVPKVGAMQNKVMPILANNDFLEFTEKNKKEVNIIVSEEINQYFSKLFGVWLYKDHDISSNYFKISPEENLVEFLFSVENFIDININKEKMKKQGANISDIVLNSWKSLKKENKELESLPTIIFAYASKDSEYLLSICSVLSEKIDMEKDVYIAMTHQNTPKLKEPRVVVGSLNDRHLSYSNMQ